MAQRRITSGEMEEWLLSQGAIPVTEEMKKEPWYAKASQLPPCMVPEKNGGRFRKASKVKSMECKA